MMQKDTVLGRLTVKEAEGSLRIGTDALLLAAYMRTAPSALAVELGAGSGIISLLALAGNKLGHIHAIELQKEAAELCRENAEKNGFSSRITVFNADIRNISPSDHIGVSVVFTNPPYMRADTGKSCRTPQADAARHELNGDIYDFCRVGASLLKTGGTFYAVYRPDRLPTLISALTKNRLTPKRMTLVHSDASHIPSSALIEAKKDGGEGMFLTAPLLLDTADAEHIYESGSFPRRFMVR